MLCEIADSATGSEYETMREKSQHIGRKLLIAQVALNLQIAVTT
jgi:hypothetical protein